VANWQVVCDEVKQWAKGYNGPKFHAILTDPPYHLYSINQRFGAEDSAPAKFGRDGAFSRLCGAMGGKEEAIKENLVSLAGVEDYRRRR